MKVMPPGEEISHDIFGKGVVVACDAERTAIVFQDHGRKLFVTGLLNARPVKRAEETLISAEPEGRPSLEHRQSMKAAGKRPKQRRQVKRTHHPGQPALSSSRRDRSKQIEADMRRCRRLLKSAAVNAQPRTLDRIAKAVVVQVRHLLCLPESPEQVQAPGSETQVPSFRRCREMREAAKMTQSQLAERAGIAKGCLQNFESGRRNNPETREKVFAALEGRERAMPPKPGTIGKCILSLRECCCMTRGQLVELAGISRRALVYIENGHRDSGEGVRERIAKGFDLQVRRLLGLARSVASY